MGIEFWSLTFDFAGKIIVIITVLLVHQKIIKEHKIDTIVLKEMHLEEILGILGIILITIGYILKLQII